MFNLRALAVVALLLALLLAPSGCGPGQQVNWIPDQEPWAAPPVTVSWSIDSTFDSSVEYAMDGWNHAAGCDVLVKAPAGAAANVDIGSYDGTICGGPGGIEDVSGATAGTARCSADRAEIRLQVLSDIRSVFVIVEHELGHALGLAHDTSELMNPSPRLYDPAQLGGGATLLVLPSDADGDAVGRRYCARQ